MFFYIFLGGAVVAVGGLGFLFFRQLFLIRRQRIILPEDPLDLWPICQRQIDLFYLRFSLLFRQFLHYGSLYSLLAIRWSLAVFRYLLLRAEQRFARLIDSIHGKNLLIKKGQVSSFLTQIKNHKDEVLAEKFKDHD